MAPEVAGSIPVSHPGRRQFAAAGEAGAEVRSSSGRAPVSKTGGCRFESCRACWWGATGYGPLARLGQSGSLCVRPIAPTTTALSSRGLGRGPLKAQTRVRIPLALCLRGYWLRAIGYWLRTHWSSLANSHRPMAHSTRPHRLSVRTGPFQGPERGSTPLGAIERR